MPPASSAGATARRPLEVELEQVVERELLLQAPVAGDLRYLVSVLRVVPELERSGDLAEHIAKRAGTGLAGRLTPAVRGMVEQMGTIAVESGAGSPTPRPTATAEPPPSSRPPTTSSTTSTTSSWPSS